MINKTDRLLAGSDATLTSYLLEDEEYTRKGIKKPAVIVCPGGGYTAVSQNEGEPVALQFAANGYHAFVLKYSVKIENPFPGALLELAAAIRRVRSHAAEWRVRADQISVCGFSAGGHLAASLGVFHEDEIVCGALGCKPEEVRPDALILGYPAISLRNVREDAEMPAYLVEKIEKGEMMDFRGPNIRQILTGKLAYSAEDLYKVNLLNHIKEGMPPVFVFGTFSDTLIPVADLTDLAALCRENNVPCELHLFANGVHGQGLYQAHCTEAAALQNQHMSEWFSQALLWLAEIYHFEGGEK